MKIVYIYVILLFIILTFKNTHAGETNNLRKTFKNLKHVLQKINKFENALSDLKKVLNKKSILKLLIKEARINLTSTLKSVLTIPKNSSTLIVSSTPSTPNTPRYVFTMSPNCSKKADTSFKISKSTCKKDPKFFDANGSSLIIKEEMGGIYKNANQTFFFSRDVKSFEDSFVTCCKLGMALVDINSEQKMLDVFKLVKEIQKRPNIFYTGGRGKTFQKTCYWWVSKISNDSLFEPQTPWLRDEPAPLFVRSDDVVLAYISNDINGLYSHLPDFKHLFVCQGEANMKIMALPPGINFLASTKNIYYQPKGKLDQNPTVIKQMSKLCLQMQLLFKDENITTPTDRSISGIGNMRSACGRNYFLSSEAVKHSLLITKCSAINMVPLIITTLTELKCIGDAQRDWPDTRAKTYFWLMGMDLNLTLNYYLCSKKIIPVPDELWYPGHPNGITGMDSKLMLTMNKAGFIGFTDLNDMLGPPQRYICEEKAQQVEKLPKI